MTNALAGETSPYLLQHKDNPVDWLPWGDEAREAARERDVPLLISIGYSSCHWCHVMERESFTDEATAAYMNEHFVPVKVDREERPDVDAIYMEALQGMTGSGGWPLTAFCDPDGVPFHCGTYFPPEPRGGMPSFAMVMGAVSEAWIGQREQIEAASGRTREQLSAIGTLPSDPDRLDRSVVERAIGSLLGQADRANGGFGGAPKFPPAGALDLLLANDETGIAELTLDRMAAGGIHDQLGGGFARYSVDAAWIVPHFEKMLYDNALLARTYLHAFQVTGHVRYREVAISTCEWALAEMHGPEGGFYSALDADSEGIEGLFYTWTPTEARAALEAPGSTVEPGPILAHLGISEQGHLDGRSVLHLPNGLGAEPPPGLAEAQRALLEARAARVRPGLDDKRLCAWNALMLGSLAEIGAALGEPRYLDAARECADFLLGTMRDDDGHLLRTYNDGRARLNAYLEDHAYLLEALLTLYEATFEVRWFEAAQAVAEEMIDRFADPERGGFFTTSHDHEELIVRRKDLDDHPAPSGNSSAAMGLLRLFALTGDARYEQHARGVLGMLVEPASQHPQGLTHMLLALDRLTAAPREIALVAPAADAAATAEMAAVVRSRFRPRTVLAGGVEGTTSPPLLADRPAAGAQPAAYVCESFACHAPVNDAAELAALLGD